MAPEIRNAPPTPFEAPTENQARTGEQTGSGTAYTRPELWLLNRFWSVEALDGGGYAGPWARLTGQEAESAVSRFRDLGLIEVVPPERQLTCSFGAAELKKKARIAGVAASGTKADIAARLVAVLPPAEIPMKYGACSAAGQALAEIFRKAESLRRVNAEAAVFAALDNGNLQEAALQSAIWEVGHVFAPGLGMEDFTVEQRARLTAQRLYVAQEGVERRPSTLTALSDAEFKWLIRCFQRATAMGDDSTRSVELQSVRYVGGLSPHKAMQILHLWVGNQRNLASLRQSGVVKYCKILPARDCKLALTLSRGEYLLSDAPELPASSCERPLGCGCTYGIVLDEGI